MRVMKKISIEIEVEEAFGNLFRERCVLVAVTNGEKYLFGDKRGFYPPGITRLLGGGMKRGENVEMAAVRELKEELGIDVSREEFDKLAEFKIAATDSHGNRYFNISYLLYVDIGDREFFPADDVNSISLLSIEDIERLAERYCSLPKDLWFDGGERFRWYDYGQLYGAIHMELVKILCASG